MRTKSEPCNVLWTGGWDSTFRVLQGLLLEERAVQPHYIIDPSRNSTGIELRTMSEIRADLKSAHRVENIRFLPTLYTDVDSIQPDPLITASFNQIANERHIGSQYDWLARYCKERSIDNMELSVQAHAYRGRQQTRSILSPGLVSQMENGRPITRLAPERIPEHEYLVYRYFSFPILDLTKAQMLEIVEEQNWWPIMKKTWFCHAPRRGRIPCGFCAPCTIALEEGFGWRIPLRSVIRRRLYDWLGFGALRSCLRRVRRRLGNRGRTSPRP